MKVGKSDLKKAIGRLVGHEVISEAGDAGLIGNWLPTDHNLPEKCR
jgi:hypothetical protein